MPDDDQFAIESSADGDVVVLSVSGEVDMATAPELAKAIELVSDQTRAVVVDFHAVTFLDSSGLNALVRGQRALGERGIELRVVTAAESPVRRVFEITQLTDSLSVVGSLDEALR